MALNYTPKPTPFNAPMSTPKPIGPTLPGGGFLSGGRPGYDYGMSPAPKRQVLGATVSGPGYDYGMSTVPTNTNTSGGGGTTTSSLSGQYETLASDQNQDQQQQINTLSDLEIQAAEQEIAQAGLSRDNLMQQVSDQEGQAKTFYDSQVAEAQDRTVQEISEGSSAARSAQQKIRRMLRGLGILASSAAGELLSQPLNEFTTQRAQINQNLTKRINELGTNYNNTLTTLATAKRDIEEQYSALIQNIKQDIRFTEAERQNALNQAKNTLREKMLEIKSAFADTQQEVMTQVQAIQDTFNPQINNQAIGSAADSFLGLSGGQPTQQVGIYEDPRKKEEDFVISSYR